MLFTHAEYEARQLRARVLMQQHSLDALFITDPGNLFYFTGFPFSAERSFPRPAVLVLPLESDATLVVHDFHFPFPWQGKFTTYDKVGELPVELLVSLFNESACGRGKVGAELGFEQQLAISHDDFITLKRHLPDVQFVDAANVLWTLRMTKTDAEIANIEQACQVHDDIFAQCFGSTRAGMTTHEIELLFHRAAIDAGARASGAIVCVGAFEPAQAAGSSPPARVFAPGEMCWVDLSLGWNGYRTDYCRAVVSGGASEKQRTVWGKMHEVLLAGHDAAKPGEPVSEICRSQLAKARTLGLDMSSWTARRFGHGSGIHTTEPPYVSLEDDTVLEPNMVIHLEPGLIGVDGIYVREEMIVLTPSGCRALSRAPWELGAV